MEYVTRTFTWKEDSEGRTGWIMDGMPMFDAVDGFGVAHDVMEHFDCTPGLEAEGMAIGALIYGRHLISYDKPKLYGLVEELLEFLATDNSTLSDVRDVDLSDIDGAEEKIKELHAAMRKRLVGFLREWGSNESITRERVRNFMRWVRFGVAAAKKRYRDAWPDDINWTFGELTKAVDAHGRGEEGDMLRVRFSHRNMDFHVHVKRIWSMEGWVR